MISFMHQGMKSLHLKTKVMNQLVYMLLYVKSQAINLPQIYNHSLLHTKRKDSLWTILPLSNYGYYPRT